MTDLHPTQHLTIHRAMLGGDPELFLEQGGHIIGGEQAIPEQGLYIFNGDKGIILDGVQIEFQLRPHTCRAIHGDYIATLFKHLRDHLRNKKGVRPSFEAVIRVDPKVMKKLSDKSKVLGCMPSMNKRNPDATVKVTRRNKNVRSAGGHIHIGLQGDLFLVRESLPDLMDIIVGNTCVLIDRDPQAAQRRKQYGRAGEYRLPRHGLEYRTLSNFWLRSYPLMSLVFGLTNIAVSVLHQSLYGGWNPEKELLDSIGGDEGMKVVQKAINTNNLKLARVTWEKVREFIQRHIPPQTGLHLEDGVVPGTEDRIFSLDHDSVVWFDYFLQKIEEKGLEYWFTEDPLNHWCTLAGTHGTGWEAFLITKRVKPEYLAAQKVEGKNVQSRRRNA